MYTQLTPTHSCTLMLLSGTSYIAHQTIKKWYHSNLQIIIYATNHMLGEITPEVSIQTLVRYFEINRSVKSTGTWNQPEAAEINRKQTKILQNVIYLIRMCIFFFHKFNMFNQLIVVSKRRQIQTNDLLPHVLHTHTHFLCSPSLLLPLNVSGRTLLLIHVINQESHGFSYDLGKITPQLFNKILKSKFC